MVAVAISKREWCGTKMPVFTLPRSIYLSISTLVLLHFAFLSMRIEQVKCFVSTVPPTRAMCKHMTPGHLGQEPHKSPPPFTITTNVKETDESGSVDVFLRGKSDNKFLGFYIQARDSSESPIGHFVSTANAKVHNCLGVRGNAAHHVNNHSKSNLAVTWKPPKNFEGDVVFTATFVQDFKNFWTFVKSEPVSVTSEY